MSNENFSIQEFNDRNDTRIIIQIKKSNKQSNLIVSKQFYIWYPISITVPGIQLIPN